MRRHQFLLLFLFNNFQRSIFQRDFDHIQEEKPKFIKLLKFGKKPFFFFFSPIFFLRGNVFLFNNFKNIYIKRDIYNIPSFIG